MNLSDDEEALDSVERWQEIISNELRFIGCKEIGGKLSTLKILDVLLKTGNHKDDFGNFAQEIFPEITVTADDINVIFNEWKLSDQKNAMVYFGLTRLSELKHVESKVTWRKILYALCKIKRLDILNRLKPELDDWVRTLNTTRRAEESMCYCNSGCNETNNETVTTQNRITNQLKSLPVKNEVEHPSDISFPIRNEAGQQQNQAQFTVPTFYCMMMPFFYGVPCQSLPCTNKLPNSYYSRESSSLMQQPYRNNDVIATENINRPSDFNTSVQIPTQRYKISVLLTYSRDGELIAKDLIKKLKKNGIEVFTERYYLQYRCELQPAEKIQNIMEEVDYIVPILTKQYFEDIDQETRIRDDHRINVRTLYSLYINNYANNGSLNSKVRPVITPVHFAEFSEKIRSPCLSSPHKLWTDFNIFIKVLKTIKTCKQ